jgi:hypothetical protein
MTGRTILLVMLTVAASVCFAQKSDAPKPPRTPWANKLFIKGILDDEEKAKAPAPTFIEHDFGTVPTGTLCTHTFKFTNIYSVPLQVVDIRTECGCLKAYPPNKVLEPFEEAEFTVTMNAAAFKGSVTKKLFVTVGPNFYSTAELQFKANSREDVMLTPGQIDFGTVAQGDKSTKAITLRYTGKQKDWKITEAPIVSSNQLDVVVKEAARGFVSTDYTINVTLKDKADGKALFETIILKTNDPATPTITIGVLGNVLPPVTIYPAVVEFANVKPGEVALAKVMVRAKADCLISSGTENDSGLSIETFDAKHQLHVVTVRYEPTKSETLRKEFKLRANLPGNPEALLTVVVK